MAQDDVTPSGSTTHLYEVIFLLPSPFLSLPSPHALHLQDALQPSRSGVFNKEGIQKFLQGIQGLVVKCL